MESLIVCVISGGDGGWFHAEVRTTADTVEAAQELASSMLNRLIAPNCLKMVRVAPEGASQTDYTAGKAEARGFTRFSFRDEPGEIKLPEVTEAPVRYLGLAPLRRFS